MIAIVFLVAIIIMNVIIFILTIVTTKRMLSLMS